MEKTAPIGVFDSGVGDLGTLKALQKQLPHENFVFYGDNANAPYGTKETERIRALSFACTDFLLAKRCKTIVIACNTASSAAKEELRQAYDVPFVAMEPAIAPAGRARKDGWVLVMATPATLRQPLFVYRVKKCGLEGHVLPVPCPKLVELIERGAVLGEETYQAIEEAFLPYKDKQVDAIVLGCTHFIHAKRQIRQCADTIWPGVPLMDGNQGTAVQLERILNQYEMRNEQTGPGKIELCTSGDPEIYLPLFETLMRQG